MSTSWARRVYPPPEHVPLRDDLPIVARIAVHRLDAVGARIAGPTARTRSASILGALVAGFFLLPLLGVRPFSRWSSRTVPWRALHARRRAPARDAALGLALAAAVVAIAFWRVPPTIFRDSFERRFGPLLFYQEEVTEPVMVVGGATGRLIQFGDGRGTAGR